MLLADTMETLEKYIINNHSCGESSPEGVVGGCNLDEGGVVRPSLLREAPAGGGGGGGGAVPFCWLPQLPSENPIK